LDKQIHISFEFSPNAPALNLRGVVSDIQTKDTPSGDKESVITVMSPFKNYRKQVLHTTYFPDGTAIKDVLELLAGTYMGLPAAAYDFTAITDTLDKFRIDNLTVAEAMRLLAEAGLEELVWVQGVLTARYNGVIIDYERARCQYAVVNQNVNLQRINAVNITGAEMTLDTVPVEETIGTLAIPDGELTEGIDRWYFYVELTKAQAIDINVSANVTTYFDFSFEGIRENYAVILATRSGAGAQGATTLTVKGKPFKMGKLQRKVVFSDIDTDTERNLENPFIQTWDTAGYVGNWRLIENEISVQEGTIKVPHNPDLKLNDVINVLLPGGMSYCMIKARKIQTTWRASDYSLEDEIFGWEVTP